jgi:hypothetical protein
MDKADPFLNMKGLSATDRLADAAVTVMVREKRYIISGRYGGLFRNRHCDYLALDLLRLEVYGPEEEPEPW